MLERESHEGGWQVTLHARGVARFFVAAFLGFWLCGWAAGEWFAGGVFLAGLRELVAPGLEVPWLPHMKNATPANPWPILGFLAVWLTFWTVGGVFALWQFLRMLFGRDRVRWNHAGVEVEEWAGPLRSRRSLTWTAASRLPESARGGLVAHARNGRFVVTGMGSADERRELHAWLAEAWRDARGEEAAAREAQTSVPDGWRAVTGDDGREVLVRDGRAARGAGVLLLLLAAALAWGAVRATEAGPGAKPWIVASLLGVLALITAAGGAWVLSARETLAPGSGSLRRVRTFAGRTWAEEWTPLELRLESSRDSDGDERWELVAAGPAGARAGTLASALHAPGAAGHLGVWLAARTGVPLVRDESLALPLAG